MAVAGWYPDPQDPASLRYFDGDDWTEHQQPAGTDVASSAPEAAADADTAAAEGSASLPETAAPEPSQAPQAPQAPPTQYDQPGYAAGGYGTQQLPAQQYGSPEYATQQYGSPEYAAPQYDTQQYAAPVPPQNPYADQPYGAQPPYQPGGSSYPPAAGKPSSKKPFVIGGIVVVVVLGLLAGAYFIFSGGSNPKFTYQGASVDKPAAVLTQAESNVAAVVSKRHGASNSDTHCYFAVPSTPAAGAKKTDIANSVYCGPVLFVDGTTSQTFLRFPLSASKSGSKTVLTPATSPGSDNPEAAPAGDTLERADGSKASGGSGNLKVPAPPAAAKDVLTSASVGSQKVPDAPAGAVMGTDNGEVALSKLGTVSRYGTGDDARSAPSGEKLIAFQTGEFDIDGEAADDLTSSTTIAVDGGTGKPVPDVSQGDYVIVAVPTTAKTVDLTLNDAGATQTISLLTGKPGAGNIALYARSKVSEDTAQTLPFTLSYAPAVTFDDGTSGTTEAATATVKNASLAYTDDTSDTSKTASTPANALLYVDLVYTGVHDTANADYGVPAEFMSMTVPGGAPVKAVNLAAAGSIHAVFEVPATFTTGVLTLSGSRTATYSDGSGTYTEAIAAPVTITITIPAS